MGETRDDITVEGDGFGPPAPGDRLRRVFYGLFFGAMALLFLDPPSSSFAFLSPLFLALFVGASLLSFRHAFSQKPELEILQDGFIHRVSDLGGEIFVPWSEIDEIEVSSFWTSGTRNHVELFLHDSFSLLRGASPVRRPAVLASRLVHRQRFLIRPPASIDAESLKQLLERRLIQAERRAIGIEPPPESDASRTI